MDNSESPFEQAVSRLYGAKIEKVEPADWQQPTLTKTTAAPKQSAADQQSAAAEDLPAPETFRPLTRQERRQLSLELKDKLLLAAHRDPDAFMADGSSQLNKFLDLAIRTESEDSTDADLSALTARHLARLPDEQFTAGLVRAFGGIQTAVRDALRQAGADPYAVDCLAILRAAVALDDDLLDRMRDDA
jgi:hypothetical protein